MSRSYRQTGVDAIIAIVLFIVLAASAFAQSSGPVQSAVDRLARRLGIAAQHVEVVSAEQVAWPTSALGVERRGRMALQVITPGYRVVLKAQGKQFEYHTDSGRRVVLARIEAGPSPDKVSGGPGGDAAQRLRQDLADRLKLTVDKVQVVAMVPTAFPDTSLGLSRPGEAYAMMITNGHVAILSAGHARYLYTCAGAAMRYGGPLASWGYSALYIQRVPMEPNLNGNLMQVSLCGTNPKLVLAGVNGFSPQRDGSVIGKRRTSRSGHELLYVAPGKYGDVVKLAGAFDFGDAAVKPETSQWVAFSRPMVGATWQVTGGKLDGARDMAPVDLPPGTRPQRLYWHQQNPAAALDLEGRTVHYELVREGEHYAWRQQQGFFPPEEEHMMLNKSESLEVRTEMVGDKPVTRVSTVWFTGAETRVATIEGFKLTELSLSIGKRFAFLFGSMEDRQVGLTVDTMTGEVLRTVEGPTAKARLLLAPSAGLRTFEEAFRQAAEQ